MRTWVELGVPEIPDHDHRDGPDDGCAVCIDYMNGYEEALLSTAEDTDWDTIADEMEQQERDRDAAKFENDRQYRAETGGY